MLMGNLLAAQCLHAASRSALFIATKWAATRNFNTTGFRSDDHALARPIPMPPLPSGV